MSRLLPSGSFLPAMRFTLRALPPGWGSLSVTPSSGTPTSRDSRFCWWCTARSGVNRPDGRRCAAGSAHLRRCRCCMHHPITPHRGCRTRRLKDPGGHSRHRCRTRLDGHRPRGPPATGSPPRLGEVEKNLAAAAICWSPARRHRPRGRRGCRAGRRRPLRPHRRADQQRREPLHRVLRGDLARADPRRRSRPTSSAR